MKIVKSYIVSFLFLCAGLFFVFGSSAQEVAKKKELPYSLSGTVRSAATKKVLPGVQVTLPGISSAMTGDDGKYVLKLPATDVILEVSGPGFAGKKVFVRGREAIDIELYDEGFNSVFGEIYTPSDEFRSPVGNPGSFSSIKENNILSTSTTADALLQGRVSGLNVVYRSGSPGNGANVWLHGLGTMKAGSQPLYVVDGIPYEDGQYSSSLVGNYFSNPLASIDIKDIESVTVMKDGTSLFGTKGANGVILIRTLQAKQMETKINFHAHSGINFNPVTMPVLNAGQHKILVSDMLQSRGMSVSETEALPYINTEIPVKQKWGYDGNTDYYRYNNSTDWQKEIYDPSFNQNYYMSVFGGDDIAVYALSAGYLDQKGSIKNTDFQRFNIRFNSSVNLTAKLKLKANMGFAYSTRKLVDDGPYKNTNPIYAALVKSPFMAVNVRDEVGNTSPVVEDYDVFGNSNPYVLVNSSDRKSIQYRFVGNFEGEYKFSPKFKMNAVVGVNFNKERERIFYPTLGVRFDTLALGVARNEMQHRVDRLFSIYTKGSAQYVTKFGSDHDLAVNGGVRYQMNESEDDWGKAYNSGSDNFKSIGYGDLMLGDVGGSIGKWKWLSFYGSVDYGFKNRYFLSYVMAADASSRFGKNTSSFLVFPSLSGAWLLTGEKFMKSVDLFDLLKLRASYGISGNDNIGNYNGIQYYVPQNLLGTYGLLRGNLVDLKLKPEQNQRLNFGLDAAFLNERINVSLDVYRNTIKDMITLSSATPISGFKYYITNGGSMRNTGLDVSVNARIINKAVVWDLGINAATYKNKVVDLKGDEYLTTVANGEILTRVGQALGVFYGYKTNGVYSTQSEAEQAGLKTVNGTKESYFSAGDVKFVNVNATDNVIDERDKTVIGNPNPDVFGSISNNFSYKQWSLSVLATYSLGNDVYNYTRSTLENVSGFDNQTAAVLNRWRKEGDITAIPRAMYGDPMGNSRFSDRWIEDGLFLKIKQLALSYTLPVKSKFFRNCTLFGTADNLLTLTKYKGFDPEFALGQSALFNGVDAYLTPQPRTFSFGIKLDL